MSAEPRRLIDDPNAPAILRALLRDTTAADPILYDVEEAAARHEMILASGTAPIEPGELELGPDEGEGRPRSTWILVGIATVIAALVAWWVARPTPVTPESSPVAAPTKPAPPKWQPRSQPTAPTEQAEIERARELLETHPTKTLEIVERGEAEHPDSPHSEERRALRVLALARLGRLDDAREYGESFLDDFARGPFSDQVRAAIE